jgi:tetratricopeptide (TPR) repeat protein
LQDAVATQIVGALAIDLPEAARRRLLGHGTADAEAWQLYANGRYQLSQRTAPGSRAALRYFEAAEQRDPSFARAAAGASESWVIMATQGVEPPSVAFRNARAAAERALSLDPELPDAHVAYGHVLTQYDRNFEGGREAYWKALRIDAKYAWAHLFLGLNTVQSVSPEQGLEHVRRAQALEPSVLPFNAVVGLALYMARRFDEARAALVGLLGVAPSAVLPRHFLARVLLAMDRPEEVVKLLQGRNDPGPGMLSNLGRAYARLGNVAATRAAIAHAESLVPLGHGVGWDLSLLHLALGDRGRALEWLERAVDDRSQMLGYLNFEPALDPLRDDPRLRAVARRINLA